MTYCDLLDLGIERECPGLAGHCERGEHCVATDATCAGTWSLADHATKCCLCGEPLERR